MSGDLEIFSNLSFKEPETIFFFLLETTICFTPAYSRNKKKKIET